MRCSYNLNATMIPGRVMETEKFELHCLVDVEDPTQIQEKAWKRCLWRRDNDGASCIQRATDAFKTKKEACATSMHAVETELGTTRSMIRCSISIPSATLDDGGSWTCRLDKCKDGKDGGCGANAASECWDEASVNVTVFFALLDDQ